MVRVRLEENFQPSGLAASKVFQILMVGDNVNRSSGAWSLVVSLFEKPQR